MATAKSIEIIINAKDNFSSVFNNIQSSAKSSTTILKGLAASFAGIGAAAVGIGTKAVKEFSDFESQMSAVKSITGATGETFDKMTDLAKEMGRTTAFTANDAGKAMEYLGMAGFNTEQIMSSLPATLAGAAATGTDLGITADILSNVMSGLGISADRADGAMDVLAKTTTISNTNLTELGEAMKYASPIAGTLGISLQETSAAMGVMANSGIKASQAGTSLRSVLTRLSSDDSALTQMHELGVEVFNSEGKMRGLTHILQETAKAMDGLTDAQKTAAAKNIAGQEAMGGFLALVADGASTMDNFQEILWDSNGAAQEMADIRLDNLKGQFELLKSAMSGFFIEIGSKLAPSVTKAVTALTEMFTQLTNNLPTLDQVQEAFDKWKFAIPVVAGVLIGALVPALIAMATAALAAIPAFIAAAVAMAPFLIGGAIVGGLIAGIWWIIQNWDMLKQKAGEVWEGIKNKISEVVGPIIESIKTKWSEASTFLVSIWNNIKAFGEAIWNGIKAFYLGVISFIVGLVIGYFEKMGIDIVGVLTTLKDFFIAFWDGLVAFLQFYLDTFIAMITDGLNFISTIFVSIWNFITEFTKWAWDGISGFVKSGLEMSAGYIKKYGEPIINFFSAIWDGVSSIASAAMEGLKSLILGALNWIIDAANSLVEKINGVISKGAGAIGISAPQIPKIPHLADGGIVKKPTLALIGEAGPEAVIPLSGAGAGAGAGGITINLTGNTFLDEYAAEKIGDQIVEILKRNTRV